MTKINLQAHYVKSEFESIGLDGTGGKVQVSGPTGKTKWINATHRQLEQIASILGQDPNQKNQVIILQYKYESILIKNGEYVTGNYPGTDLCVTDQQFLTQAQSLAITSDCALKVVILPHTLPEEYETEDIMVLARQMGYITSEETAA